MVTPPALDRLFADWLAAWVSGQPTDGDLAAFIAALPIPAQRRAAQLYARGFLRGCEFCTTSERAQADTDLAAIAELVATIRERRAQQGPGSTN